MAKPGTWKPGQSGNPNGRPPKNRTLTEILKRAGNKTVSVPNRQTKIARKRLVADMVWSLLSDGKTRFSDDKELVLSPSDWLGLVKWVYSHIDGPPKSELELTGADGGPIVLVNWNETESPN